MTSPVFANIKIQGKYAEELREESDRRKLSQAALATKYVIKGMEARREPDTAALASTERRIAATMLALRGDVESLTATVDVAVALGRRINKIVTGIAASALLGTSIQFAAFAIRLGFPVLQTVRTFLWQCMIG